MKLINDLERTQLELIRLEAELVRIEIREKVTEIFLAVAVTGYIIITVLIFTI